MIARRALGLVFALATVTGCAGARNGVVADEANYPVSLSRGVRDQSGEIVTNDRVKKLGRFHDQATSWGTLYSLVPLSKRKDISTAVNEQVAKMGGDAIVNLRVSTAHCASDFFFVLTIIPFWPGCSSMKIDGDIIKVEARK